MANKNRPSNAALRMREYRARLKYERQALIEAGQQPQPQQQQPVRPVSVLPGKRDPGRSRDVEDAVRAELKLLHGSRNTPGLAAIAINLAQMLDTPGLGSSGAAAQLRATLGEIRVASVSAADGTSRMASLRAGVSTLKTGA